MVDVLESPAGVDRSDFLTIVSAAYTAYIAANGSLPDVSQVMRHCPELELALVKSVLASDEFAAAIKSRGVNWDGWVGITAEQQAAVALITNPADRRSLSRKLGAVGVSYSKYQAWMRDPVFSSYITRVAEQMLGDNLASVHSGLARAATDGKVDAIKFYYELTGRYNPAQEQVVNLKAVLSQVIEIIQRRVTDPEALQAIAQDFAMLSVTNDLGEIHGVVNESPQVIKAGPAGIS